MEDEVVGALVVPVALDVNIEEDDDDDEETEVETVEEGVEAVVDVLRTVVVVVVVEGTIVDEVELVLSALVLDLAEAVLVAELDAEAALEELLANDRSEDRMTEAEVLDVLELEAALVVVLVLLAAVEVDRELEEAVVEALVVSVAYEKKSRLMTNGKLTLPPAVPVGTGAVQSKGGVRTISNLSHGSPDIASSPRSVCVLCGATSSPRKRYEYGSFG